MSDRLDTSWAQEKIDEVNLRIEEELASQKELKVQWDTTLAMLEIVGEVSKDHPRYQYVKQLRKTCKTTQIYLDQTGANMKSICKQRDVLVLLKNLAVIAEENVEI